MKRNHIIWLFLLVVLTPRSLYAVGDPKIGAEKAQVCSACHGSQGISTNPDWPHLAGQNQRYLIKQLHDFKQGNTRNAPVMAALTANLSDTDIEHIAAFYAQMPSIKNQAPQTDITRGEALYRHGDIAKHITACIACHSPDGTGNTDAGFPLLRGQQSAYTIQQLQAFKSGQRHNDLNTIMHDISSHMDDNDIKEIAIYLANMH